jgi:type IV pilus assembly protein PilV
MKKPILSNTRLMRHERGTTLIEILIAVVVMAAGLLGLAGLQMNSLQYQKSSSSRSEAAQAIYDLGERMRANWQLAIFDPVLGRVPTPAEDRLRNEANYTGFNRTYAAAKGESPAIVAACSTGTCTAQQIATNDFAEWLRNIQRRLPGGAGSVLPLTNAEVSPGFSAFLVVVMWQEQGFTGTDPACNAPTVVNVNAPAGVKCLAVRVTI